MPKKFARRGSTKGELVRTFIPEYDDRYRGKGNKRQSISSLEEKEEKEDNDLTVKTPIKLENHSRATRRKPESKAKWKEPEDGALRKAVQLLGAKNWKNIAEYMFVEYGYNRTDVQCLHRWNKVLKPGLVKGAWTPEEDAIVIDTVNSFEMKDIKWSVIAEKLPGRIGKQCRERWFNHLDPTIKKTEWNEDEDRVLFETQQRLGNHWCQIAELLPGRSENAVKNRWNSSARKRWCETHNIAYSGPVRNGARKSKSKSVTSKNNSRSKLKSIRAKAEKQKQPKKRRAKASKKPTTNPTPKQTITSSESKYPVPNELSFGVEGYDRTLKDSYTQIQPTNNTFTDPKTDDNLSIPSMVEPMPLPQAENALYDGYENRGYHVDDTGVVEMLNTMQVATPRVSLYRDYNWPQQSLVEADGTFQNHGTTQNTRAWQSAMYNSQNLQPKDVQWDQRSTWVQPGVAPQENIIVNNEQANDDFPINMFVTDIEKLPHDAQVNNTIDMNSMQSNTMLPERESKYGTQHPAYEQTKTMEDIVYSLLQN